MEQGLTKEQVAVLLGQLSTPMNSYMLNIEANKHKDPDRPTLLHFAIIAYIPRYVELAKEYMFNKGIIDSSELEHYQRVWQRTFEYDPTNKTREEAETILVNRLLIDFLEDEMNIKRHRNQP